MMERLEGRVAVVTGGASGIGYALAETFLESALKVAILDVEEAALEAAERQLAAHSDETLFLHVDVTDRTALAGAARQIERRFGRIDIACNNAGVGSPGPADNLSFDDWDWVLGVNLGGVINGMKIFVDPIKRHGDGGHIVNTASLAGFLGGPGGAYPTSKAAVIALSESYRLALEPHNIGVSVLCPALVRTNIFFADRNRPAIYSDTDHERTARMRSRAGAMRDARDPRQVAALTLNAIRRNLAYVFDSPAHRNAVADRFERILKSFDRRDAV